MLGSSCGKASSSRRQLLDTDTLLLGLRRFTSCGTTHGNSHHRGCRQIPGLRRLTPCGDGIRWSGSSGGFASYGNLAPVAAIHILQLSRRIVSNIAVWAQICFQRASIWFLFDEQGSFWFSESYASHTRAKILLIFVLPPHSQRDPMKDALAASLGGGWHNI